MRQRLLQRRLLQQCVQRRRLPEAGRLHRRNRALRFIYHDWKRMRHGCCNAEINIKAYRDFLCRRAKYKSLQPPHAKSCGRTAAAVRCPASPCSCSSEAKQQRTNSGPTADRPFRSFASVSASRTTGSAINLFQSAMPEQLSVGCIAQEPAAELVSAYAALHSALRAAEAAERAAAELGPEAAALPLPLRVAREALGRVRGPQPLRRACARPSRALIPPPPCRHPLPPTLPAHAATHTRRLEFPSRPLAPAPPLSAGADLLLRRAPRARGARGAGAGCGRQRRRGDRLLLGRGGI